MHTTTPRTPTLPQILRAARNRRGLTTRQAAALVPTTEGKTLSRDTLKRYERGKRKPTITTLRKLAQIYELNFAELVDASDRWHGLIRMLWEQHPTLRERMRPLLRRIAALLLR